ncbi:MAG: hypothetical protein IH957_10420 [Chloroflexi bacterium]|nr:hypothetical protein [Chloroflexota bacterium]
MRGKPISDGLVGESMIATNIIRDIGASLRDVVGGRSGSSASSTAVKLS